jgi:hypothetical protein
VPFEVPSRGALRRRDGRTSPYCPASSAMHPPLVRSLADSRPSILRPSGPWASDVHRSSTCPALGRVKSILPPLVRPGDEGRPSILHWPDPWTNFVPKSKQGPVICRISTRCRQKARPDVDFDASVVSWPVLWTNFIPSSSSSPDRGPLLLSPGRESPMRRVVSYNSDPLAAIWAFFDPGSLSASARQRRAA